MEVEIKTSTGTKYYKLVKGHILESKYSTSRWNYRLKSKLVYRTGYYMFWGNEDDIHTMGISRLDEYGSRKSQSTITKMFMKAIEDTKNLQFTKKSH